MSQRVFRHNNREVSTGWDQPLRRYFLVIEEGDRYLFSNLNLRNPAMTLEEIEAVLNIEQINWPETLFTDLKRDRDTGDMKRYEYPPNKDR